MGLQNDKVSELINGKIPLDILTEITEASFQASTQEQIEAGAGQCSRPSTTVVSVEFALSLGTRLAKALTEIENLKASKGRTQEHDYYRAGEKDCPSELKAPNGELHTLQCRKCGKSPAEKCSK